MPDYIATVQRILVNHPNNLLGLLKVWTGNLPNVHITIGDPEPYIITADTPLLAFNIAANYFEEDYPSPPELPEGIVDNLLIVVRTPSTRIVEAQEFSISVQPELVHTPKLEPYAESPDRWIWHRTETPHGPTIPGPAHLTAQWFDRLIDGEREGQPGRPIIQWYFNRLHALNDARHAGAPIRDISLSR